LINERIYFVDLPGYGYAKVSKTVRDSWGPMIEDYLQNREQLKLAVMLVDSRISTADSDVTMKRWLDRQMIPNTIVLTKTDKISNNQLQKALRQGARTFNTKEIIAFSAVSGAGKDDLLARISAATTSVKAYSKRYPTDSDSFEPRTTTTCRDRTTSTFRPRRSASSTCEPATQFRDRFVLQKTESATSP